MLKLHLEEVLFNFENNGVKFALIETDIISGAHGTERHLVINHDAVMCRCSLKFVKYTGANSCALTHLIVDTLLGFNPGAAPDLTTTEVQYHSTSLVGSQLASLEELSNHAGIFLHARRLKAKQLKFKIKFCN